MGVARTLSSRQGGHRSRITQLTVSIRPRCKSCRTSHQNQWRTISKGSFLAMTTTTDTTGPSRLAWELPELVALVVPVVVAVLAVAGLVTGIMESTGYAGPSVRQQVGSAIEQGAAWSGPIIAVLLLGALGACWWQREAWTEVADNPDDAEMVAKALGHVDRSRVISRWIVGGLALVAIAAIAAFVGALLLNAPTAGPGSQYLWGRDVYAAGVLLATLLVTSIGLVVARVTWAGE